MDNKSYGILILLSICLSISLISCEYKNKEATKGQKENATDDENQKWIDALIKAYRAFNEDPNVKSADLLFEASELMPKKNWEIYFMTATVYAPNGEKDKAFSALKKAIQVGLKESELIADYPKLSSLKDDPRWNQIISSAEDSKKKYIQNIENPNLLKVLEDMWAQDQKALSQYEENIKSLNSNASNEEYQRLFKPVEDQWEINRTKLDSIINIHGWPGNRLVGEDGAKLAWAIPQHYPDVFFKEKCLSLIKEAVEKGDLDPNHYAELNDRIARETWQKQTYGASMGEKSPYPIKDPVNVNARRIELGLIEPIEIYAYYHGIEYQIPNAVDAKSELNNAYQKAQAQYAKFEEFINKKNADSANVQIVKGIGYHGDISNEQLYRAAIGLAQMQNKRSTHNSLKILKVLVWRKWERRQEILDQIEFNSLHSNQEWVKIKELLEISNR